MRLFSKKKKEVIEVIEVIEKENEIIILSPILEQRVIIHKSEGEYIDGYVTKLFDQAFLVSRLDGLQSLIKYKKNKSEVAFCELLTIRGIPVLVQEDLKNVIDLTIKKQTFS